MGCPFRSLAFFKILIIPCPIFLFLIIIQSQYYCTAVDNNVVSDQKVNVSVYYEAKNRSCASFIITNLAPIFNNGLIDILNLRLVPLLNNNIARVNQSTNATICQSGTSDDCLLSTLQACTINVYDDLNKHFALIYCYEFLVIERRSKEWNTCFHSLGLPPKPVLDCLNSINGTQLVQNYASESAHLNPPHTFVPWVVVNNNQSIGNDYRNFTDYACKAYKGTSLPIACQIP